MLSILGLFGVIFATYYVYKTARDTKRNAVGWALATFAVGFGFQIVLPLLIGVVIGIVMSLQGSSPAQIQEFVQVAAVIITLICLALSFAGIYLIMRRVSTLPDTESFVAPPAPPDFNG